MWKESQTYGLIVMPTFFQALVRLIVMPTVFQALVRPDITAKVDWA